MPNQLLVSVKFGAPICVSCQVDKRIQILAPGGWLLVMGGGSKADLGTVNNALHSHLVCLICPEDEHSPQSNFDFLTNSLNAVMNQTAIEPNANR